MFSLSSAERKISNALYKEILIFLGSDKLIMLFFMLENVEMPTSVGILTFMSRKIFYAQLC